MSATYEICIDWNNDDDFGDADENITSDVLSLRWMRGKDEMLKQCQAGTLELVVKNTDGKYSPENESSPLYGNMKINRPIRIRATLGETTYNLYYGFVSEYIPHPHPSMQTMYIYALDGIHQLGKRLIDIGYYEELDEDTLINAILDAAGWDETKREISV